MRGSRGGNGGADPTPPVIVQTLIFVHCEARSEIFKLIQIIIKTRRQSELKKTTS